MLIRPFLTAITSVGLLATAAIAAPPSDPDTVFAVPRYTNPITVVVKWNDLSTNEENFEIHRREEGGTYSFIGSAPANATEFEDPTATPDKYWEYRVRARHSTEGNSNWVEVDNRTSPKRIWPLEDGDHDILHNFGTPITSGSQYLHEGVDISASTKRVIAAHGGRPTVVDPTTDNNGGILIDIDMGGGVIETNYGYNHLHIQTGVAFGQTIAPGDLLGTVSDDAFTRDPEADHVHWGSTQENTLKYYSGGDRDPNTTSATITDNNTDSDDFIVVDAAANDHTSPREPAWGGVDFLVDAHDDMAANLNLNVAPFRLSYWIQSGVPGGSNVRSAAAPYRLFEFDFPLIDATGARPSDRGSVYWGLNADIGTINTWQSHLTWVVTNTDDTNGAYLSIDDTQFWKTDLRTGTGTEPNGSDGSNAREIQEAAFPDGKYFVNLTVEDLSNTSNRVREVLVDNFQPYVKRLSVYSGASLVYTSEWSWNAAAGTLTLAPADLATATAFPASRTSDMIIEVEFSEPMSAASIPSINPLGLAVTLSSDQSAHRQTTWRGRVSHLDIADDGTDDGTHTIAVSGADLAGTSLLQIGARAQLAANHNNRNATGSFLGASGQDTAHGVEIGGLSGAQTVSVIFARTSTIDPLTPSIADKTTELENWLNDYYDEISYGEISFQLSGDGWYQLSQPLNWYFMSPRTPLVDLVGEAITLAEAEGADFSSADYVLVVTDETALRDEWSTSGAWPYTVSGSVKPMAAGVLNLGSVRARVSHLAGRMVGLMDLFAHPEVSPSRAFVGPWSHMSDKDTEVHVAGWEKWQAGWIDEAGTATGVEVERVEKPAIAAPIANRDFTIAPLDADTDDVKLVAIEIGEGLHYTVEYRRSSGLDSSLPDSGVLIAKSNDFVAQGEGTLIVSESGVTSSDLSDATFTTTSPRDTFSDVGSGVDIEVTSIGADEAEIRLNYAVPPFENDLFVDPHDGRWKSLDIWVDAPDVAGAFEADPKAVITANEKPVVGEINKVYGRVRNFGATDATNFEVELEILDPWGTGGSWRRLEKDLVSVLQGSATNPGAEHIIEADWTPTTDSHACIKLRVVGVANDINLDNNDTQENVTEFTTTMGSPYEPIISRFQVHNPFTETLPFFYRVDGLPEGWTYLINPARPVISADGSVMAQIIIQPNDGAPICIREEITVQAYAPRVDTLKSVGGITLAVSLKSDVEVNHESWSDCECDCPDREQKECRIYTRACTDPGLPNISVAAVYTTPDGSTEVRYVNTDADGCFTDMIQTGGRAGTWSTEVVIEETDCEEGAVSGPIDVVVSTGTEPGPCDEYRKALQEFTEKLRRAMAAGDDDAVKQLYEEIRSVLDKAVECDPVFEKLFDLYEALIGAYFSGDKERVEQLLNEIETFLKN